MLNAVFLVIAFIVLFIIYDRIKYRRTYKLLRKFPVPKGLPLIGIAYDVRSIDVIIGSFLKYFHSYGSTFAVWIFGIPIVVVSDPKHLKIVLNSKNCLNKEKRYEFSRDAFGSGLIIAPAKLWKKNRKLINPALNHNVTESFVPTFVKHGNLMLEYMEKCIPENKPFDMDHFFMDYAMDILMESAMGIDDEMPRPPGFVTDMNRMAQILVLRSFRVWLHPDFIFRMSPLGCEFYKLYKKLKVYFKTFIGKRYVEFHSRQKEEINTDGSRKKPFLEHLLSLGDEFTIKQLEDEVVVFLSAGIETTSAALGYLFVCLGALKEVQEKVVEELLYVFGESDRSICIEDVSQLKYLERVIKETMRIFSIAPLFARSVDEDIDLGDYVIPKGASLIISVCATHRNKQYWPDPLKFDPERFSPSQVAERHPYSYLPFSGGPRNCIGKHYAMMNMKIMAALILRKFKINSNISLDNIRSNFEVVARIKGGAKISIEKRHKE